MYHKELENLEAAELLKDEYPNEKNSSTQVSFLGHDEAYLNFTNSDFFGLQQKTDYKRLAKQTLDHYGVNASAFRYTTGTIELHTKLENRLAQFIGTQESILYSSAYLAYLGLFDCLTNGHDSIFIDSLSSPGLIDGARLSHAKKVIFRNNDLIDLEHHLKKSAQSRFRLIVSDHIFGINGSSANIDGLLKLADQYNATLVIDESLSLGIKGELGLGLSETHQLKNLPVLITGSLSNAVGAVNGGYIAGPSALIRWFKHASRSYIFSSPCSPVSCALALHFLEQLENSEIPLEKLNKHISHLSDNLKKAEFEVINHSHPIISVVIGDVISTQKYVDYLFENNIIVSGLCFPNVPKETARIKIHLSTAHTKKELDLLVNLLVEARTRIKLQK